MTRIERAERLDPIAAPVASAAARAIPPGPAKDLQDIWIAVRAAVRGVVEHVTLADLASGNLPEEIRRMGDDPDDDEV